MTTYTAIADSEIDPESPGTTTLFTKLRDNPIAITEGAAGAPNIQTAAINDQAVTTAKLAPTVAGNTYLISTISGSQELQTSGVSYQSTGVPRYGWMEVIGEIGTLGFCVLVAGQIRVKFDHRIGNATYVSYARIVKNGTQVQEWTNGTTTYATRSADITVDVGDTIIVQHRSSNVATNSAFRNIKVYSSVKNMAVT